VGARPVDEDPATAPMNHSNRVVFDEAAMAIGVATYVAVALRHLGA
jgi:hippurate hydrolase